jgi:hypothetical protein
MIRRRLRYDPRELSFTFEVMADHIETLRVGNSDIEVASPSPQTAYDDDALISDIFCVPTGTVRLLLEWEGYMVRMDENIRLVHEAWVNSQRSSPSFETWQQSWNYFKRTGLFQSVAGEAAAREKPAPADAPPARNDDAPSSLLPEYTRLGVNSKGVTVYELKSGGRMISRDPSIMQIVDGDKDTPELLYSKGNRQYLTVEETAAFAKAAKAAEPTVPDGRQSTLWEVVHDRRPNSASGNSPARAQARNDPRSAGGRVHQFGLFDFGQVGAEQPGRIETPGTARDALPPDRSRPSGDIGSPDAEQRRGLGDEPPGDERLGDFERPRREYGIGNYRITPEDRLGFGGAKAKYADNIAAIRLLQALQGERAKEASPEEKKVLVRYVGWGGIPQAFDPHNEAWGKEYRELQSLLSPDDYAKARRSTQDASYTYYNIILKYLIIKFYKIICTPLDTPIFSGYYQAALRDFGRDGEKGKKRRGETVT